MHGFSEIVPGRLWSGTYTAALNERLLRELLASGLVNLISVVPIQGIGVFQADRIQPRPLVHRIAFLWDDTPLAPIQIDEFIEDPRPTFIHCNMGQNRSSMLAACWILRHGQVRTGEALTEELAGAIGESVIAEVLRIREDEIGSKPRFYPEQLANVRRYACWALVGRRNEEATMIP